MNRLLVDRIEVKLYPKVSWLMNKIKMSLQYYEPGAWRNVSQTIGVGHYHYLPPAEVEYELKVRIGIYIVLGIALLLILLQIFLFPSLVCVVNSIQLFQSLNMLKYISFYLSFWNERLLSTLDVFNMMVNIEMKEIPSKQIESVVEQYSYLSEKVGEGFLLSNVKSVALGVVGMALVSLVLYIYSGNAGIKSRYWTVCFRLVVGPLWLCALCQIQQELAPGVDTALVVVNKLFAYCLALVYSLFTLIFIYFMVYFIDFKVDKLSPKFFNAHQYVFQGVYNHGLLRPLFPLMQLFNLLAVVLAGTFRLGFIFYYLTLTLNIILLIMKRPMQSMVLNVNLLIQYVMQVSLLTVFEVMSVKVMHKSVMHNVSPEKVSLVIFNDIIYWIILFTIAVNLLFLIIYTLQGHQHFRRKSNTSIATQPLLK